MATLKKIRNINMGTQTVKYRTTGDGAISKTVANAKSGAALTKVGANTYALAGANDRIDAWMDVIINESLNLMRVFTDDAYIISGVICNGTPAVGSALVGYSDSDRGKAKEATITYATPATPTVQELKTAVEIVQNAKWSVDKSSAGLADVTP